VALHKKDIFWDIGSPRLFSPPDADPFFFFFGLCLSLQPFWTRLGTFLGMIGISIPNHILKLVNHAVIPLFLVAILFMGPMLMMFLSNELPFQQAFNWAAQRHLLRRFIGMRNFVVGPISEEFVFRACMVAIVYQSGASAAAMIFGLPLVFGVGKKLKKKKCKQLS